MRDFKFFQKEEEKIDYFRTIGDVMRSMEELNVQVQNNERVFTEYMDQMDDYFLGGIQPRRTNERL
jgi:hypothetical protein